MSLDLDINYALFGKLRRMHHVRRYSSMPLVHAENVAEHSWQVTMLSYLIGKDVQARGYVVELEELLSKALVHDISEILSGDIIRPYKYSSRAMREACQQADVKSMAELIGGLYGQDAVNLAISDLFNDWAEAKGHTIEGEIVKLCDALVVVSKCVEEKMTGNGLIDGVLKELYEGLLREMRSHPVLDTYVKDVFPSDQWDDPYPKEA